MVHEPFFAILDGALNFDCYSCNASCCRGGYGTAVMHGQEWDSLKQKYPLLSHFAIDQGKYIFIINHGPECFFLNHQYLCQIEHEYTRGEKPLQCRLFPYQVVGQLLQRPIIQVALLCPYTIDQDLQGNIRRENFYKEMGNTSAHEIYHIFDEKLSPYLSHHFLLLEEKITEQANKYFKKGDFENFLLNQLDITRHLLTGNGILPKRDDICSHQIMEKIMAQQCKFLAIDLKGFHFDKSSIGRSMIALSPILRFDLMTRHPYIQIGYLLALYLYSLISKEIHSTPLTVQAVANINFHLSGKLEYLALFPFSMLPKASEDNINSKAEELIKSKINEGDSGPLNEDKAAAFHLFLDDLIKGKVLGLAANEHFGHFSEFTKNQFIEYFIHYLSSFFSPSLDEEAFLLDRKADTLTKK